MMSGRSWKGLALLVLMVAGSTFTANAVKPDLRVGVMGDQTGSADLEATYSVMKRAADRMEERELDFIIHVGDMTESITGITDSLSYAKRFERAAAIMDGIGAPWRMTAGDHDVNPPGFAPGSNDRSRERWLQAELVGRGLPVEDHLYYSHDIGGYHFVFLYSLETLHTDPRWGSIFRNRISDEQLAWLRSDLDSNRSTEGIIVVLHHPMWYSWVNYERVHALLKQYPVKVVLAGHYHYDQREEMRDGIQYLVMGSTGGVVKQCDAASGGAQEYGVLEMSNGEFAGFTLYEVEADTTLELTPRGVMDRMQALSSMLSNLWTDETLQRANGSVRSLESDSPPEVFDLESLGNPINLPVKISVTPKSSLLSSARWLGEWEGSGQWATFQPGARIGYANYSTVGNWYPQPAVWQAKLSGSGSDVSGVGVRVEVRYQDHGPRWIAVDQVYRVQDPPTGDK
jgi:predicted phosphodiesterase